MSTAIEVTGLGKLFRRTASGHKLRTLKSALLDRSLVLDLKPEEAITALRDVSFEVEQGEAVGLIGSNGSGKSTLLKLVAGILKPSAGYAQVRGRTAALIELGAGFHPEISGRENIYIYGAVLGLSRREIDRRFDDIVAFSGLDDFIEEPVKNYSSGMYVRLGFSVAVHIDPDVLLVDEVLAVGDEAFAHRCLRRIEELLARGKTLLLVSHSLPMVEDLCDRVVWLDRGTLRLYGEPRRVVDAYRQAVAEDEGRDHRAAKEQRELAVEASASAKRDDMAADAEESEDREAGEESGTAEAGREAARQEVLRWGSGEARIEHAHMLVAGEERYHFQSGAAVAFEMEVHAKRAFEDFVFGIGITTPRGIECWGTNTDLDGFLPACLATGTSTITVACPRLRLAPGEYLVDLAVHARNGTPYDYRRKLLSFSVTAPSGGVGIYFPEHRWTFSAGVGWKEEDR